jgi:hypothetical protein
MASRKQSKLRIVQHYVRWMTEEHSPTMVEQDALIILKGYEYVIQLNETSLIEKYKASFLNLIAQYEGNGNV